MNTYVRATDQRGQHYVIDKDAKIAVIPNVGDRITTPETFSWYLLVKARAIHYEPSGAVQVSLKVERVDDEESARADD